MAKSKLGAAAAAAAAALRTNVSRAKCAAHRLDRHAPHAEHIGFVAYAASEAAQLHWALWFVAVYLTLTGLWVVWARVEG